MPGADADPFASTESYYAEHRPGYGEAAIAYLDERFDLSGKRVLDLGCGAGQVAVPLAARAGGVLGMDPNAGMLDQAREKAADAGRSNCHWVRGSDAELGGLTGPVRLVTMGRSFHWMDRERTLEDVHGLTDADGGVAILGDPEWLTKGTRAWQDAVYAVADQYVSELPERTGPVEYDDPYDELLTREGFVDVETREWTVEREWTVDGVVGYVFSLSFCSPATVSEDARRFEAALRDRLAELDAPFVQRATVAVVAGRSSTPE